MIRLRGIPIHSRGFSLLELVVVVVIIGVLMAVAVSKYLAAAVDAERVGMEMTLSTLRSAINLKMADYILQGKSGDILAMESSNPMDRLSQPPSNYAGEVSSSEALSVPTGNWYFDRNERMLIYRVHHADNFQTKLEGPPRARFRVRVLYQDRNSDGKYDAVKDKLEGMVVEPVEPYSWLRSD